MIALLLASTLALAAPPKALELKLTGPEGAVLVDTRVTLPYEGTQLTLDVGDAPYRVDLVVLERHDTVVVEASVQELKGRKAKPVERAHPKLILYEDFQGHADFTTPPPKGAEAEVSWALDARWAFEAPEAPAEAPAEAPPAPDEAPAEAPAEAPPAPE